MERGHLGRSLSRAVIKTIGDDPDAIAAAVMGHAATGARPLTAAVPGWYANLMARSYPRTPDALAGLRKQGLAHATKLAPTPCLGGHHVQAISPGRWTVSPQPQEESLWRKGSRQRRQRPNTRKRKTGRLSTDAIREYVEVHQCRHGQGKTAGTLGVSRHTLWRYLKRGHAGRAVPAAVLECVGRSVKEIEAATLEIIIDLEGLRPDPALRPLRRRLEDALLLLCATPLATVDELASFGRVPTSTLRERLEKLAERGLADSVSHHLGALGSRPQRRYFPTDKGVTAAGAATQGRRHMLTAYPLSRQWFRLLAERLDAVAVLYRVAAMIADADPKQDDVRVDHHRHGPYDLLVTLSGGLTIGVIRQGPMLPTSNLRYRLRSIEHLPSNERPFLTLVVTHADQATRRAIRSLGDPSERRRTFVATEGELLAGDHAGVVWQQCGYGLGLDPPVEIAPGTSLAAILPWADGLLASSRGSRSDVPRPDADALYSSNVQAAMPEPAEQMASALAVQLTRAEKDVLDLLAAWPLCSREQLAGLMGGVTLRRVNQALRPLRQHDLVQEEDSRLMLTDRGLDLPGPPGPGRGGPHSGPLDRRARRIQSPGSTPAAPCAP